MSFVLQKLDHIKKRFISIFRYIIGTPILYISLFSILFTFISFYFYNKFFYEGYELRKLLAFLIIMMLIHTLVMILYIWMLSQGGFFLRKSLKRNVQIFSISFLCTISLSIVFLNDSISYQKSGSFTGVLEGKEVKILDISRKPGTAQQIIFEMEGIRGVGYIDWFANVGVGDTCYIYADISPPENLGDFDYKRYLRNRNIYLYAKNINIGGCFWDFDYRVLGSYTLYLKRSLINLRENVSGRIDQYLPEPQSSLLFGILFGSQRAFESDFEEKLRASGTSHIISASGYNITVLMLLCNKVFGFIKKKSRLVIILITIWLFCIFTGFGSSILRASMMSSITILAIMTGNVRNTHHLIPMCAYFLLLMNPKILFDIGFQLSSLATLGLVYLMPSITSLIEKTFNLKRLNKFFTNYFLTTISCTLAVLPISISVFGKFSIVSIFSNVLIMPLTEITMLYSFLSVLSSYIYQPLASYFFSIPFIQLRVFEEIIIFFGTIEWGYLDISVNYLGFALGIFLFLFCIYFHPIDGENYYIGNRYGF